MSRSRRKTPIFGFAAESDHQWKKKSARKLRRNVKQHLATNLNVLPFPGKRRDVVNPWSSDKDGKHYWGKAKPKDMRK